MSASTATRVRIAVPMIGSEERAAVDRVMSSGQIGQGPEVAAFESEFSELVGGRECVAVNSGTSALHVSLLSIGIGAGDEVIVPSFTFAATANAVRLCGADPVFVDIDPVTFCIDPESVRAAIGPRTAAIVPVHLYGQPAEMGQIAALASRHGLAVVEDAAQAHAARFGDTPVGALGDAAAFSFYPTKNMTTGEGGMAVFADKAHARTARLLRSQGMERQYENEIVGFNLRMTDLAAAIGRVQLGRLPGFTGSRRSNAAMLSDGLADALVVPIPAPGTEHVFHQYTVRSAERDRLHQRLEAAGIETRSYYPTPVHRLLAFQDPVELPETERAAAEVLSLPVGPHVTPADVERIVEAAVAG